MTRIYIAAACAALAIGAVAWAYRAGVTGERARLEAERAQTTIEALKQSQKDRTDAQNLDDDGLIDALGRWLLPAP